MPPRALCASSIAARRLVVAPAVAVFIFWSFRRGRLYSREHAGAHAGTSRLIVLVRRPSFEQVGPRRQLLVQCGGFCVVQSGGVGEARYEL